LKEHKMMAWGYKVVGVAGKGDAISKSWGVIIKIK
jgi:hypothetical protein